MRCDEVEDLDRGEGDALLDRLYAHCDQPRLRYSHRWRPGDVLTWYNRSALHQATFDFDQSQRRYLHRIMLRGDRALLAVLGEGRDTGGIGLSRHRRSSRRAGSTAP